MSISILAQNIDIQGHRGCRGLMPENSLEAFREALKYKVTTLELDLVISKDKKVVVSHEPYMNSLFCSHPDGKPVTKEEESTLNLYQMTYAQIKKYDSGSRGNARFPEQKKIKTYKPLLETVFKDIEAYLKKNKLPQVQYNIEIKSEPDEYNISQPEVAEFCDLVYKVLTKNIALNRVNIQSFDFEILKHWHKKTLDGSYKKVKLAALVEDASKMEVGPLLGFEPELFSPYYQLLTDDIVKKYQAKGIKVIPWTVNEKADLIKVAQMGVDGIITDYPNRWLELKAAK